MGHAQYQDLEFLEDEVTLNHNRKLKDKVKKRKWREIELVKEKRRLKKELMTLEYYQF